MTPIRKKALQYVKNTNGGASKAHFVVDHEPIGWQLWDELFEGEPQYITIDSAGHLFLTEAGERALSEDEGSLIMTKTYDCPNDGVPKRERRAHQRGPKNDQVEELFNGFHNAIENAVDYQRGYLTAMRDDFASLARAALLQSDVPIETEAQGFALEAIWQFCPELETREDNLTVLTPAQLETVLRRCGWKPPGEWRATHVDTLNPERASR